MTSTPESVSISYGAGFLKFYSNCNIIKLLLLTFILPPYVHASPPLEQFIHPGQFTPLNKRGTGIERRFLRNGVLKRNDKAQFIPPATNGGFQLTFVDGTYPAGLGEPINIIISGTSDERVLKNQMEDGGLLNYFQSVGFDGECLGQHIGGFQRADLGDGNGQINQTAVLRWNYGNVQLGTCKETFDGGNHFRYWIQNGPKANTGAIFLAVSYEKPASAGHDIVFNGYNLARDEFIGNATSMPDTPPTETYALVPPSNSSTSANSTNSSTTTLPPSPPSSLTVQQFTFSLSPSSSLPSSPLETLSPQLASLPSLQLSIPPTLPSFEGQTTSGNFTYKTTAVYVTGLLGNTSEGINHFATVGDASTGVNAVDGLVALLEVQIVKAPGVSSGAMSLCSPSRIGLFLSLIFVISLQSIQN